jgi:hypothetical protein
MAAPAGPGAKPPAASSATQPTSDLDYWLSRAKPVEPNQPGAPPQPQGGKLPVKPENDRAGAASVGAAATGAAANPFRNSDLPYRRSDALPGVIELSDGNQLPGGLYTTVEKPWIVWSEATKSWRRVDFLTLLSIEAVVEEQRMELSWRPKGMGEPEKVYTGRKYPMRRMHWRFKLIDGSVVEGSTKGQPVFVELTGKVSGPFILGERMKGEDGQTLEDLVYVRKIVVSRKMMDLVIAEKKTAEPVRNGGTWNPERQKAEQGTRNLEQRRNPKSVATSRSCPIIGFSGSAFCFSGFQVPLFLTGSASRFFLVPGSRFRRS